MRDRRNDTAWSTFITLYGPPVFELLHSHLHPADVEDVAQNIFMDLARKLEQYDPAIGQFRGWILGFVLRHLKSAKRSRARRERTAGGDEGAVVLEQQESREIDPAREYKEKYELACRKTRFKVAWQEARQLGFSENSLQAFWLTAVEGEDPVRVADQLGMTRGAVYVAKCRVLKCIQEIIQRIEREWGDAAGSQS
jgi:RNA polymerase sigma-70 factor (ECF subfamily)